MWHVIVFGVPFLWYISYWMTRELPTNWYYTMLYAMLWECSGFLHGSFTASRFVFSVPTRLVPVQKIHCCSLQTNFIMFMTRTKYYSTITRPLCCFLSVRYSTNTANNMLATIVSIQPKDSSGSGGETRESVVYRLANEMLEKLPADFLDHEVN